jgi:DNA-binding CsgD family transcriptional regulator
MKVSLTTKYCAPQRTPRRTANLSLLNPSVQKPLLALQSAMESRTFLKAAERLIHAAIPCDVVYTLLHYSMDRGRSMTAWGSDGAVFTNEYVRESLIGNPLGWVLATKPGVKSWPLCDCYPNIEAMERDPFFLRFIQGIGIYHATVMIFWREGLDGADLVIGPHRGPQWPKFSPEEVARIELIHPHIDAAYRRVNKLQSQSCARRGLEEFVASLPLPALLVEWDLRLLFHNASASEAVARWNGADPHLKTNPGLLQIPANLRTVIETLREEWTTALRENPGPALFRERDVAHPTVPGWRALISMTALRSPHFGKPSFVVRFELPDDHAKDSLAPLTKLSAREQKLVRLVCDGQSNQEIAESLGRSVNTVKSELHAIFKKLGISSRARLMALLR